MIDILDTYGKECLTTEEFEQCLDRQLSQYYTFLARRWLVERDRGFWSYHKRTFAKAGISFSRARLAKAVVGQLCGSMMDPKSTVESIRRLFLLKKIRNRQMRKVVLEGRASPSFRSDRVEGGDQAVSSTPSLQQPSDHVAG
jgi:hypothetical protein